MYQPVGTWADTASARSRFAVSSCRHSAVISGSLPSVPPLIQNRISSIIGIRCNGMVHQPQTRIVYADTGSAKERGAVMAQKVQTLFVDDLDGSEAEGTVRFGLDGTEYEIDLNAKHAQALRDALARYVAAARRTGSTRRPAHGRRKTTASAPNSTEVRDWAKTQG